MSDMLLEVGRIVKPHGLRGEVVLELVTNRTERVAVGSVLRTSDEALVVEQCSPVPPKRHSSGKRYIIRFAGIRTVEVAERLRDVVLRAEPLEDEDALWVHELVGARVEDLTGETLGEVVAVESNPASDLIVLGSGGLIPLRFVTGHEPGKIVVDIPVGLLDLD